MKRPLALFALLFTAPLLYGDAGSSSTKKLNESKTSEGPILYHHRIGFGFNQLVYERIMPNRMYLGLDASSPPVISHSRHQKFFSSLVEAELRIGYNLLYNNADFITPIVGGGYLFENYGEFKRAKFAYVTIGFLYLHEFDSVFSWGFNLKPLAGQQISRNAPKKFVWGVDLAMPFVFRFGSQQEWDFILKPIYLYLESHHRHQGAFAGLATAGYRF
jgi:hypothetical protein